MISTPSVEASAVPFDVLSIDPGERLDGFLVPGVFGDEPALAALRLRLRPWIALDLLDLPGPGARGAVLTDMRATGQVVADEIARRRPTGSITLVGYSFGASVALEVAAQLVAAGRTIGFLGVLDGPLSLGDYAGRHGVPHSTTAKGIARTVAVDLAGSMDGARRLLLGATSPEAIGADRSEPVRKALLWHLRNKAIERWRPTGCDARGVHVHTGTYGVPNRERWAALCPNLTPVHVAAAHVSLLEGHALDGRRVDAGPGRTGVPHLVGSEDLNAPPGASHSPRRCSRFPTKLARPISRDAPSTPRR